MKENIITMLLLILSGACNANVQKGNVTWYAIAAKEHSDFISLTHRGLQKINILNVDQIHQTLAVRMHLGDGCYEMYARTLPDCIECPTVKFNNIIVTEKFSSIPDEAGIYIHYEIKEQPKRSFIEAGYDMVIYWKS